MVARPLPASEPDFNDVDDAAARRIDQTLALTERFIDAVFEDPSLLDGIPNGASLVFLPSDDDELAEANKEAAVEMRRAGASVALVRV
jgi:hypothetical protein